MHFDCSWSSNDLGDSSAVDFHGRDKLEHGGDQIFGPRYKYNDSDIFSMGYLLIIYGKYIRYLVIIYVDQLPAVGGSSVSSTSD